MSETSVIFWPCIPKLLLTVVPQVPTRSVSRQNLVYICLPKCIPWHRAVLTQRQLFPIHMKAFYGLVAAFEITDRWWYFSLQTLAVLFNGCVILGLLLTSLALVFSFSEMKTALLYNVLTRVKWHTYKIFGTYRKWSKILLILLKEHNTLRL